MGSLWEAMHQSYAARKLENRFILCLEFYIFYNDWPGSGEVFHWATLLVGGALDGRGGTKSIKLHRSYMIWYMAKIYIIIFKKLIKVCRIILDFQNGHQYFYKKWLSWVL